MSILLFGLTGGIASGKSSVGRRWKERGLPVIDADVLSRRVVEPGTDGLAEIVLTFGREFLNPEGALNRRKLGELVFANTEHRLKLESILLPKMRAERDRQCEVFSREGHEIACYEAAMIVEKGNENEFRPLVVAMAPEEVRVQRIMKRDDLSEVQARLRMAAQALESALRKAANFVINTDQDKNLTRNAADAVLDMICLDYGINPHRYPR